LKDLRKDFDEKFEKSRKTSKVSKGRRDNKYYSKDDDYYNDKKRSRKPIDYKEDYSVKGRDNKKDDCYNEEKHDKKHRGHSRRASRDIKDGKRRKHSKSTSWSHSRSCSSDKKKEDKILRRWGCGKCVGKHCPHRMQGKHGKCRSGSSSSSDGKGVESTVTVINIAPASGEQTAPTESDGIVCVGDTCWKCAGGKCKRTPNPDCECSSKKVCSVDNNGHAKVEITESCKIDRERKI
jgi:hypothetical protein